MQAKGTATSAHAFNNFWDIAGTRDHDVMPIAEFDGVFANTVFFHVPSDELPRVLLALHNAQAGRGSVQFQPARARPRNIVGPLCAANKLSDLPDFNDATKLGSNDITAYDPTCGSGSLLLKVGDAATAKITL